MTKLSELESLPAQVQALSNQIRLLQLQINELRDPDIATVQDHNTTLAEGPRWTVSEDDYLRHWYSRFVRVSAKSLGRSDTEIHARLRFLKSKGKIVNFL